MKYIKKFEIKKFEINNIIDTSKYYISKSTQSKIDNYYNNIITKLGDELSKYLKVKKLKDYDPGFNLFLNGDTEHPFVIDKVYLINDDFGCVLIPNKMNDIGISIYTVYKSGKKYRFTNFGSADHQIEFFYTKNQDIEIFVKNIIDMLEIKNKIRIKNKKIRDFKNTVKRYNL